jgi:flagellar protein FliS
MKQGYNVYKSANVDTADQGKLILICYDVAIMHCKQAIEKFDSYEMIEERTKHIFKAQDAITELLGALRMDVGEIARNLYRLYDFMLRSLVASSVQNDKKKVHDVLGILELLRDAWSIAIQKVKAEAAANVEMTKMAV